MLFFEQAWDGRSMNAVVPVELRLVSGAEQSLDQSLAACPEMTADCEPHGGAALRDLCADSDWPVTDQTSETMNVVR
jgi:hypothetical protein